MTHPSPADLLVLHAVRLKGFAGTAAVAGRFGLDTDRTREDLLDAQAHGRVSRSSFADLAGWSLTQAGYRHNEAQLRDELDRTGARGTVTAVHEQFLPRNARASRIFTAWQLSPGSPAGTFHDLAGLAGELRDLERPLAERLSRFAGYHDRFTTALARASDDPAWITGIEVDSCHKVWFELHEDLIATLGITR
ncbi:transcriptional regulator [Dactylosporangium sp. NPDC051485]|uniref:transcriptional regulator n=1 Tax=Dactylosporangium sp. NPDC051485 TaxID=3154846 RepID=UPI0034132DDA